jgi:hypothetical protein
MGCVWTTCHAPKIAPELFIATRTLYMSLHKLMTKASPSNYLAPWAG